MFGANVNSDERPPAVMGTAPRILQPCVPLPLPEAFRQDLVAGLHAANSNLHELARAARPKDASRAVVERAIANAWSNLATIERIAGLDSVVSKASRTRWILVVDDSADMRFLVTRALKTIAPHALIQTASDAAQALSLLDEVDEGEGLTVISDHDMGPGPTGVDLLATIASRHPRTHRVLFTGFPVEYFQRLTVEAHALLSKDAPDALRRYFGAP